MSHLSLFFFRSRLGEISFSFSSCHFLSYSFSISIRCPIVYYFSLHKKKWKIKIKMMCLKKNSEFFLLIIFQNIDQSLAVEKKLLEILRQYHFLSGSFHKYRERAWSVAVKHICALYNRYRAYQHTRSHTNDHTFHSKTWIEKHSIQNAHICVYICITSWVLRQDIFVLVENEINKESVSLWVARSTVRSALLAFLFSLLKHKGGTKESERKPAWGLQI